MPTVYRRRSADGTHAQTFTADIWIDGTKFCRSTGQRTRREAQKRAQEIEAEIRLELKRQHDPLTIDTAMGKYWKDHASKLASARNTKYFIKQILTFMDKDLPLAELSNKTVYDFVLRRNEQGVSASTINRELDIVQAVYTLARDRWEHPVRPIKWSVHRLVVDERQRPPLTVDEARLAIQIAATRSQDLADAIELSIYTGLRQNELETLAPARINLADRTAVVLAKRKARQGYRERTIYLNTPALALLSERLETNPDKDAPLLVLTNARKMWDWVRARIGRPDVRWHDLRHTHGTLLGKTSDVRVIKNTLGHSNIATTMRYVRQDQAQAIEAVETIPALSARKVVQIA